VYKLSFPNQLCLWGKRIYKAKKILKQIQTLAPQLSLCIHLAENFKYCSNVFNIYSTVFTKLMCWALFERRVKPEQLQCDVRSLANSTLPVHPTVQTQLNKDDQCSKVQIGNTI